ncbi:MAG: HAD-IA family hydrolase [Clostridia bacterium]|nr:HAD-IA family hydrolase [Clostridia bacterium]
MKLAKAILFDLDDTILCYKDTCDIAWRKVCVDFAAAYPSYFESQTLNDAIQKSAAIFWSDNERNRWGRLNMFEARRQVVAAALSDLKIKNERLSEDIADTYSKLQYDYIKPFPGAIETLEALSKMKVRMILVTNGSTLLQWAKIERFKLHRYFEDCLVEGDLGYGKPDIRIFNLAMKHLNLPAAKVWAVGNDLQKDIQIPKMLGMYTVWNDIDGSGLKEDSLIQPDRIVSNISEIL